MNRALQLHSVLAKFPKVNLGIFPTPVHRLNNFEKCMSHDSLWIKRDDLTGLALGGNKTRNLEYLLGTAIHNRCDTIIVPGPIQSNLCCVAAAATRKLGLRCIQVFNDDRPPQATGNSILNELLDVESHYIGNKDLHYQTRYMEEIAKSIELAGNKPYIIYNGSATSLGALGYVCAALEIYEQILESKLDIKNIIIGAGYGGTAAGLIFGVGILGIPFHIHVISVEYEKRRLDGILKGFMQELEALLGITLDCNIYDIMTIYDDYMGEGWGCPTKESNNMVYKFPQMEGIFIEKVYTSKPLVGMIDLLNKNILSKKEGVCYWHTGGLPALFA